jgi:peptidoglycan/LPS O-acetylase OafA/YrhL
MDTTTWGGRFLRNGYTAVGFFFVLSGYILAHVYLDGGRPFDRRKFWISRFARVYPLLAASLVLDIPNSFLVHLSFHRPWSAGVRTLVGLVSELALLQAWDGRFRTLNPPSWSVSAEAFFYLLFPFVGFWVWQWRGRRALALLLAFWALALSGPLLATRLYPALFVEVDSSNLQWAVELMPIFRVFEFLAGICLCSLQKSMAARLGEQRLSRASYLFLGAAVAWFAAVIAEANHVPLLVMSNGFLLPVDALVILSLANARGRLCRLFSHRAAVVLGESSYAVYLLHSPIWLYFSRFRAIDSLPIWCAYIAIVLAVSLGSFFLLERPARRAVLSLASVRPRVPLNQEQQAAS